MIIEGYLICTQYLPRDIQDRGPQNLKTTAPLSLCCSVLWVATMFLFMVSYDLCHCDEQMEYVFQIKQNSTIVLIVFCRALIMLIISTKDVTVKVASGSAAVQSKL